MELFKSLPLRIATHSKYHLKILRIDRYNLRTLWRDRSEKRKKKRKTKTKKKSKRDKKGEKKKGKKSCSPTRKFHKPQRNRELSRACLRRFEIASKSTIDRNDRSIDRSFDRLLVGLLVRFDRYATKK